MPIYGLRFATPIKFSHRAGSLGARHRGIFISAGGLFGGMKPLSLLLILVLVVASCSRPPHTIDDVPQEGAAEHCATMPQMPGCKDAAGAPSAPSPSEPTHPALPAAAAQPSAVVDLADGQSLSLSAEAVRKEIRGTALRMYGYNGQIPGPLLRVKQGSTVTVTLTNLLEEPTTIHWHGLRLDNRFDGVAALTQEPVVPGGSFSYTLTFPDAGVYWYHPHLREDRQQELGLYGNILVEPTGAPIFGPANREELVIVDDLLLQDGAVQPFADNAITHALMGRFGNVLLLNGNLEYSLSVRRGEVVRFYFTNAANTRPFRLAIPKARLKLVGGDSGPVLREEFVDAIVLSPGERAIVDVYFPSAGQYALRNDNPQAAATLGTITALDEPAAPDHSADFLRRSTNAGLEREFSALEPSYAAPPDVELVLGMQGHGAEGMGRPMAAAPIEWDDPMPLMNARSTNTTITWQIRDKQTGKANMDLHYQWSVGQKVKVRIFNDPHAMHPMQHPIHFHGQRFVVLARDGVREANPGWKDTVLVPTGSTVDILLDVTNPGAWMAHCHIAEHLHSGMMFRFDATV